MRPSTPKPKKAPPKRACSCGLIAPHTYSQHRERLRLREQQEREDLYYVKKTVWE